MDIETYSEARMIFDEYNGCYFHMERDGKYYKYKEFGVPKEIEIAWIFERRRIITEKLSIAMCKSEIASLFSQYSETVNQINDENGLLFMLKFAKGKRKKLDSFTNVRIVESILNSLGGFDAEHKKNAIIESLELLKDIENTAFCVSDNYKIDGTFPDYLTESKILERISLSIEYWGNELKSNDSYE